MIADTLDITSRPAQVPLASARRREHRPEDTLVLTELNPESVIDHIDGDKAPVVLSTFGGVREVCPKCHQAHLRLVLRQGCVRTEHLFCAECASCFGAHYPSGMPAWSV
jgi:hypothetical protein